MTGPLYGPPNGAPVGPPPEPEPGPMARPDDVDTGFWLWLVATVAMVIGYVVDLGKLQGVRQINLQTPTPGFRVEIYATDVTTPPPDILDTRWSHIKDVSNVGAQDSGKQKIVLGAGTSKYRNVLLWFTEPPTDGPRLRVAELDGATIDPAAAWIRGLITTIGSLAVILAGPAVMVMVDSALGFIVGGMVLAVAAGYTLSLVGFSGRRGPAGGVRPRRRPRRGSAHGGGSPR